MTQAAIQIEPAEKAIIEKYDFSVSVAGNAYVVRDKKNKKLGNKGKLEGGNLYALLCRAVDERKEVDAKQAAKSPGKAASAPKPVPATAAAPAPSAPLAALAAALNAVPHNGADDEFEADELDDSGGKERKTPKEKQAPRDPATLKTRCMITTILLHPEYSTAQVLKACENAGFNVTAGTIGSIRATAKQTLSVIDDLGWLKPVTER